MNRPRQRLGEPVLHATCWVLKLERATGETGYFTAVDEAGIRVKTALGGLVQRFPSRAEAERCVRWLNKQFGLDIEEATPEEFVHDQTYSLWFGNGDWPDGIGIELDEKSGVRYLLVRDDGEEMTSDLDDNVADALIRLLEKLKFKLRQVKVE